MSRPAGGGWRPSKPAENVPGVRGAWKVPLKHLKGELNAPVPGFDELGVHGKLRVVYNLLRVAIGRNTSVQRTLAAETVTVLENVVTHAHANHSGHGQRFSNGNGAKNATGNDSPTGSVERDGLTDTEEFDILVGKRFLLWGIDRSTTSKLGEPGIQWRQKAKLLFGWPVLPAFVREAGPRKLLVEFTTVEDAIAVWKHTLRLAWDSARAEGYVPFLPAPDVFTQPVRLLRDKLYRRLMFYCKKNTDYLREFKEPLQFIRNLLQRDGDAEVVFQHKRKGGWSFDRIAQRRQQSQPDRDTMEETKQVAQLTDLTAGGEARDHHDEAMDSDSAPRPRPDGDGAGAAVGGDEARRQTPMAPAMDAESQMEPAQDPVGGAGTQGGRSETDQSEAGKQEEQLERENDDEMEDQSEAPQRSGPQPPKERPSRSQSAATHRPRPTGSRARSSKRRTSRMSPEKSISDEEHSRKRRGATPGSRRPQRGDERQGRQVVTPQHPTGGTAGDSDRSAPVAMVTDTAVIHPDGSERKSPVDSRSPENPPGVRDPPNTAARSRPVDSEIPGSLRSVSTSKPRTKSRRRRSELLRDRQESKGEDVGGGQQ